MSIIRTRLRPRPRPPRRAGARTPRGVRALIVAGALTVTLLLAACGSGSHPSPVASLGTPGGSRSHSSSALTASAGVPDPDGRPRESLDDSAKQKAALYDPYLACIRAHQYVDQTTVSARVAVAAKCEKLEPLAPWQIDPANPQARAFIGATVACMEAKGYHARAVLSTNIPIEPPQWDVEYSPYRVDAGPGRPTAAQDECQQEALR